jgi:hypothetical protein
MSEPQRCVDHIRRLHAHAKCSVRAFYRQQTKKVGVVVGHSRTLMTNKGWEFVLALVFIVATHATEDYNDDYPQSINSQVARVVETYWAVNVLKNAEDTTSAVAPNGGAVYRPNLWDTRSVNPANNRVLHRYRSDGSFADAIVLHDAEERPASILWSPGQPGLKLLQAHIQLLIDNGLNLQDTSGLEDSSHKLWSWLLSSSTGFEPALHNFISTSIEQGAICALSQKEQMSCELRDHVYKNQWFVSPKPFLVTSSASHGRRNAGITPDLKHVSGAKNFFLPAIPEPDHPKFVSHTLQEAFRRYHHN